MNEIDKLDGMVKIKGKCGYEFIGGCKDLRSAKQKLEKIEEVITNTCDFYKNTNDCKTSGCSKNYKTCSGYKILKIIRGEDEK